MPTAADALYPNGPDMTLGNASPDKVLGTFSGNHEGALMWGEKKHKEAYVAKYGYEKALDVISQALKVNEHNPQAKEWTEDMSAYRDELLSRQGS